MSYAMDNFGSCYLLDVKSTSPKIGNITDTDSLKRGRLGVYCDSQQNIRWSALSYKYDDQIFLEKYFNHKTVMHSIFQMLELDKVVTRGNNL